MKNFFLFSAQSQVSFPKSEDYITKSTLITAIIISAFVSILLTVLITELVHMSIEKQKHTVYLDSPDYYCYVQHKQFMLEPNPTRDGYRFCGWYLNPELTDRFNQNTPIVKDLFLYAKWEKMS